MFMSNIHTSGLRYLMGGLQSKIFALTLILAHFWTSQFTLKKRENCFGADLFVVVKMRGWPLVNDHPDGPASCKWSTVWTGLLQMIIRMNWPLANDHPELEVGVKHPTKKNHAKLTVRFGGLMLTLSPTVKYSCFYALPYKRLKSQLLALTKKLDFCI